MLLTYEHNCKSGNYREFYFSRVKPIAHKGALVVMVGLKIIRGYNRVI